MASQESQDSAAAEKAAAITQQTTQQVLQYLKDLYAQQREDQLPWLQTGASALQKQAYLMGLSGANHLRSGGPRWTESDFAATTRPGGDFAKAAGRGGWDRNYDFGGGGGAGGGGGGGDGGDGGYTGGWERRQPRQSPDEFPGGYASNPLALITGMGRRPAGGGMVRLMAPTGEVRAVSSAQAPYYLAKGARPA